MALHNFVCPACGFVQRDVNIPISVGATKAEICCPACEQVEMEWIPQIGRMSASNGPTFTAFETTDGRGRKVRVESIADLRRIESESEKMARDGTGQIMVWRDYSNNRSNKDQSAIPKTWTPTGNKSDERASDWHDHPDFTTVPTLSSDEIAEARAAAGGSGTKEAADADVSSS